MAACIFITLRGKNVISYKLAIIQKQFWPCRHQIQTVNMKHSLCKLNLTSKVDLSLPHVLMFEPSLQELLWITWCIVYAHGHFHHTCYDHPGINCYLGSNCESFKSPLYMSHCDYYHFILWVFFGIKYIDSDEVKNVIDIYTLNSTH